MARQGWLTFGGILAISAALASSAALPARSDVQYLGPPGAPAQAFPGPERPVADIVSPTRSNVKKRDANDESGQLARLMGLKPGMTVGDIGAGNGYHTLRL